MFDFFNKKEIMLERFTLDSVNSQLMIVNRKYLILQYKNTSIDYIMLLNK